MLPWVKIDGLDKSAGAASIPPDGNKWIELRHINDKLLNYIKGMVFNDHDAEDILQEVSIKIY